MQVLWYGIKTGTWSVFRGMWLRKCLVLKPTRLICSLLKLQSVLNTNMHVALLTFSWSRKDGELIWYHDKGDCISDPVSHRWMPHPLCILRVKSCSSLLCQSCKLIPVTAVVTLPSVLGFSSTEMVFRSNGSCIHCSSVLVASSRSFRDRVSSEQWSRLFVCLSSQWGCC